jgi:protein transport protein SEC24
VIKVRTSTGFSVTEYFGGFLYKETVDFELAAIDSDKTISVILRNDEKMKENQSCFVQFAMLYTNSFGEKRIRVFNMSI